LLVYVKKFDLIPNISESNLQIVLILQMLHRINANNFQTNKRIVLKFIQGEPFKA